MDRIIRPVAATLAALAVAAGSAGVADATQKATRVTTANLPAASQVRIPGERVATMDTITGHHVLGVSVCQTKAWAAFKPNAEFTRRYSVISTASGEPGGYAGASIASFATHAHAARAASQMARSLSCVANVEGEKVPGLKIVGSSTRRVTLAKGVTLHVADVRYRYNTQKWVWADQVGVMAVGTHVEIIGLNWSSTRPDAQVIVRTARAALPTLAR